jgi:hypothetical protein
VEGFSRSVEEFLHNPIEVIAALVVIVTGAASLLKSVRQFWLNLWARLRSKPYVPSESLRIVQNIHQSHWGVGSSAGIPSMMVIFEGHVTDISGRPNQVLKAEIPNPLCHSSTVMLGEKSGKRHPSVLAPGECTGIQALFFVQPVVGEVGKPWHSTLIFIDKYGNRHKVKNCVFRGLIPPAASVTA